MIWALLSLVIVSAAASIAAVVFRAQRDTARASLTDSRAMALELREKRVAESFAYEQHINQLELVVSSKNDAVLTCRKDFDHALAVLPPSEAVAVAATVFDRVLSAGGPGPLRRPAPSTVPPRFAAGASPRGSDH